MQIAQPSIRTCWTKWDDLNPKTSLLHYRTDNHDQINYIYIWLLSLDRYLMDRRKQWRSDCRLLRIHELYLSKRNQIINVFPFDVLCSLICFGVGARLRSGRCYSNIVLYEVCVFLMCEECEVDYSVVFAYVVLCVCVCVFCSTKNNRKTGGTLHFIPLLSIYMFTVKRNRIKPKLFRNNRNGAMTTTMVMMCGAFVRIVSVEFKNHIWGAILIAYLFWITIIGHTVCTNTTNDNRPSFEIMLGQTLHQRNMCKWVGLITIMFC